MYQEVLIFILACAVLVKSADVAISGATTLARAMHLTEFLTSFLLVAFISSLPEALISIFAATRELALAPCLAATSQT